MAEKTKIKINDTGDCIFTEQDVIDLLYTDPTLDISKLFFEDPSQYNASLKDTGLGYAKLETVPSRPSIEEFDQTMINNWHMPETYYQINVKEYLLDKCQTQGERDRVDMEYLLFEKKQFVKVLQFLIYFVDTLRENNVVWGVGRGSSVASFCLFLIGVHKINPLQYNLDITEFLR
jgi:DNA polymerase III alpha subunit|tara:strand:- start:745 stop:1272 length:528 start_codon:yes stop_codon:yes gene_type:complete